MHSFLATEMPDFRHFFFLHAALLAPRSFNKISDNRSIFSTVKSYSLSPSRHWITNSFYLGGKRKWLKKEIEEVARWMKSQHSGLGLPVENRSLPESMVCDQSRSNFNQNNSLVGRDGPVAAAFHTSGRWKDKLPGILSRSVLYIWEMKLCPFDVINSRIIESGSYDEIYLWLNVLGFACSFTWWRINDLLLEEMKSAFTIVRQRWSWMLIIMSNVETMTLDTGYFV